MVWRFRKWLAALIRPEPKPGTMAWLKRELTREYETMAREYYGEASVLTEFVGGIKDGDREVVVGDVYPVTAALPIVLSPWGDDRDASDLCRVVRLGTYYRSGGLMVWSREWCA